MLTDNKLQGLGIKTTSPLLLTSYDLGHASYYLSLYHEWTLRGWNSPPIVPSKVNFLWTVSKDQKGGRDKSLRENGIFTKGQRETFTTCRALTVWGKEHTLKIKENVVSKKTEFCKEFCLGQSYKNWKLVSRHWLNKNLASIFLYRAWRFPCIATKLHCRMPFRSKSMPRDVYKNCTFIYVCLVEHSFVIKHPKEPKHS